MDEGVDEAQTDRMSPRHVACSNEPGDDHATVVVHVKEGGLVEFLAEDEEQRIQKIRYLGHVVIPDANHFLDGLW